MLFVEPFFLFVILPLAVLAFYGAGRFFGQAAALCVLVAVSVVFYAPYGLAPAAILLTSLGVNLVIGLLLASDNALSPKLRQLLLTLGLAFNFLALGTFKYLDNAVTALFPGSPALIGLGIPAGISFYTFHQAVFLMDAFNRHPDLVAFFSGIRRGWWATVSAIRYSAFVAFFPQLVIGPITYMREFGPQVLAARFGRLRLVNVKIGLTLVVIGLFKKMCLADPLAEVLNPIYALLEGGKAISFQQSFFATVGFYFQLYFDFSGYSDIALGIARLFGIRLPVNFDSPLRSTGIIDFYRRWHITLTRVIALFLFTPLSLWGTRFAIERGYKGWKRRAFASWLPFMVNFQMIALWHAAKGTFVLFGLIHGLWFVLESEWRSSRRFKALRERTSERTRFLLGLGLTAFPLMLTFALFRCESLDAFFGLLKGFTHIGSAGNDVPLARRAWWLLAGAAAIVYLLPNPVEFLRRYRPGILTFVNPASGLALLRFAFRPNLLWALFVGALWVMVMGRINKPSPFLYAGF